MPHLCNLQVHINGQQTFYLSEVIISRYSGRLKKIIKEAKKRTQIKNSGIEIDDFPGGPQGFELVSRFCYNNGRIKITFSNVSLLHCCAVFLGMTENEPAFNLLQQTQNFLQGMFYWSWNDLLMCLKGCETCFTFADSYGLVENLVRALMAKIAQNSEIDLIASTSSSSSSPETVSGFVLSSSSKTTPESMKPCSSSTKEWWFNGLTTSSPVIIERLIKNLGAYGNKNDNLILTRFLLCYLKSATSVMISSRCEYSGLADTAVHGVISVHKTSFSCRKLFWILRVVSCFSLSKECRGKLERLIGGILDQATLDDLLISGHDKGVYDVNLVLRLIREFVKSDGVSLHNMKKVGVLIDKYLCEISPDHNLKISKFLGVAQGLPDSARDCFDAVYRAIDIYLESHPCLSFEERSRLCRCLNYEKLSFEACKELAKNPRVPPNVAVEALKAQQPKIENKEKDIVVYQSPRRSNNIINNTQIVLYNNNGGLDPTTQRLSALDDDNNEEVKQNLERMQWRVVELEKACKEMKAQMSRLIRHTHVVISSSAHNTSTLPRLC